MSDQTQWRQEGEGKHPTLAGNIFDPNSTGINTGSGLTGSNTGSGLTGSSDTGLTGSHSGSGLTGSSGSGLTGSNTSSGLTGSSDSGYTGSNSATSGLAGSSATKTAEDGSSYSSGGGIVQSALNMVGLGGASTSRESEADLGGVGGAKQPDIVRDFETAPPTGGAGSERAGFGAAETGDLSSGRSGLNQGTGLTGSSGTSTTGLGGDYDGVKDRSSGSGLTGASALGAGALGTAGYESSQGRGTSNTGLDRRDEGVSGNSIGDNSNAGESTQNDTRRTTRDVTSDHDSEITDRAAREQVADSRNRESDNPRTSGPGQNQDKTSSSEHAASLKNNPAEDKKAATRENTSSIPTAGGERLGQKHWGESKIVPDNPKPQSEAGVQSSDNDATTSSNTAANTGGATGPPGSHGSSGSGEKEGVVGKIKDKLHIGGSS